jgi:hypothetical protein
VSNEIFQKAQKALATEVAAAKGRFDKAEQQLAAATTALATAKEEFEQLNSKYQQFLILFPIEETILPPAKPAKEPKTAIAKPKSDMTLIDKIIKVMGNDTMSAGEVETALDKAGYSPTSNNVRGYISTLLSQQTVKVRDAQGQPLRDPNTNDVVRVLVFTKVDRGRYQVTKIDPDAIMAGLRGTPAPAKDPEVLLVESGKNQADALFASQGLDVAALVSSQLS